MSVQAGDIAPDFEQDTLNGSIRFHEWMGRSWCILFSQPGEAGSELARMAELRPEWHRRGVKLVGLAVLDQGGDRFDGPASFPVVADADRTVSALYGVACPGEEAILRTVWVIDPDKKVRLVRTFPPGTPCDFAEMLTMVDCLQLADALGSDATSRN